MQRWKKSLKISIKKWGQVLFTEYWQSCPSPLLSLLFYITLSLCLPFTLMFTSLFLPLSRLQHNKTLCYPIIFMTLFYSTILDYTKANIMECYYIIFYYSEQTLHSPNNNYKNKRKLWPPPHCTQAHIYLYKYIMYNNCISTVFFVFFVFFSLSLYVKYRTISFKNASQLRKS